MVATRRGGKQRVLVTGGSGFVGRHIVDQLLAAGRYEVTVFDIRGVPRDDRPGLTYVTGDLTKAEQVLAAVQGE